MRLPMLVVAVLAFCSSCSCGNASGTDGGSAGGAPSGGGAGGGSAGGGAGGSGGAGGDAGEGTATIEIPTLGLDWAQVDCGPAPADKTVTVRNTGTAPLRYSTLLSGSTPGFFVVKSGGVGTVAPGQMASIAIGLKMAGVRGGFVYGAGVVISSNDPAQPAVQVPLQFHGRGANLTLADVDLGTQPLAAEATATGQIINTGDVAAQVTFGPVPAPFAVRWAGAPTALAVPPGVASAASFTLAITPTQPVLSRAVVPVTVAGVVCEAPHAFTVSGTGASGVFTGAADVDFGLTPCGQTGSPRHVTLGNSSGSPYQVVSATLGKGSSSPFTLSGFTPNMTVPANGSVTLTVTPLAIPSSVAAAPGDFGDVLVVTTSIPADTEHVIRLTQGARGAILSWVDGRADFGQVPPGTTASSRLSLVNLGNAGVTLTVAAAPPVFSVVGSTLTLEGGDWVALPVGFAPAVAGPATGFVTLNVGSGVLCGPVSAPAPLDGVGLTGTLRVSETSLFVPAGCGTTPDPTSVTLENTGAGPVTFTATLQTQPSAFDLSLDGSAPAPTLTGTLAAGRSTYLAVLAKPVGTVGVAADLRETLVISTGGTQAPRQISIQRQALGARLEALAPGPVVQTSSAPAVTTVWLTNRGTTAVLVTPSFDRPEFSAAPVMVVPWASTPLEVSFDAVAPGTVSSTLTLTSGGSTCELMPRVELTGRRLTSDLVLSRSSIDFPTQPCALTSASQTVTLSNVGSAAASWAFVSHPQYGPTFEVLPLNGTLGAGQTVELRVTPLPLDTNVINQFGLGPQVDFAEIRSGSSSLPLRLSVTPGFALIGAGDLASSTPLAFGDARVGSSVVGRLRFSNGGNLASTLRVSSTNPLFRPSETTVLPGSLANVQVTFSPTAAGAQSAMVVVTPAGGCGGPMSSPASGNGVTDPKPTFFSPSFDLGPIACQTPSEHTTGVTLTNGSAQTLTFDAGVVSPRAQMFEVTPGSGTLTIGQSTVLQLKLKSLVDVSLTDDFGYVLVHTSQGDRRLPIDLVPQGAVVGATALGFVPADGGTANVYLVNVGNLGVTVAAYFAPDAGTARASFSPPSAALVPRSATYTQAANDGGSGSGELRVNVTPSTAPVCRSIANPIVFE